MHKIRKHAFAILLAVLSLAAARALAAALGKPVLAGSLHLGVWQRLEP